MVSRALPLLTQWGIVAKNGKTDSA